MTRRRALTVAVAAPISLIIGGVALLAVQAQLARSRAYVPDPGYEIDRTIAGTEPVIEMVMLGDSTVAGLGVDDIEATLPVQVAQQVAEQTGRAVRIRGFGVSGALTADVVREQLPAAIDATGGRIDVIAIEVGSNDVTHRTSLGAIERDTRALHERAREHADVVVQGGSGRMATTNFARPLRDLVVWRARAVRRTQGSAVASLDDPSVGFIDMGGAVAEEFGRTPNASSDDGFHPGAAGYAIWARAFGRAIAARIDD